MHLVVQVTGEGTCAKTGSGARIVQRAVYRLIRCCHRGCAEADEMDSGKFRRIMTIRADCAGADVKRVRSGVIAVVLGCSGGVA